MSISGFFFLLFFFSVCLALRVDAHNV
jgi:hypothetical protein